MTISIGVQGASGGLGASSLVSALAVRAAQSGRSVVCVDHRESGGGLDVVLGVEQRPGLRWPDLQRARGRLDAGELVPALPGQRGVRVVTADRRQPRPVPLAAVEAVRHALSGAVDLVVHDLPHPCDQRWPVLAAGHDLMLVVAGEDPQQVAAASATILLLRELGVGELSLAVRTDRRDEAAAIAELLDAPLAAVLREDRSLRGCLARGAAPGSSRGALRDAADQLLAGALLEGVAA
ncbi:hypothetical protein [Arsenicicoccus sp. oral taxon 190]|uniref:hypothetical protein n=1 Tax=Arsenicicoccus sp. oral taxon 190 TaxID=1658671 RepID=UPI00067AB282|nr:hypothetical protein [Arsenicicoccus sp. oral taxon 190]